MALSHRGVVAVWSATQLEAYALVRDASAIVTAARPLGTLSFTSSPAAVALVGLSSSTVVPQQQQQQSDSIKEGKEDAKDVNTIISTASIVSVFVAVGTRVSGQATVDRGLICKGYETPTPFSK